MNKIYKVIWSKVKNCYVAVSELTKNKTKAPGQNGIVRTVAAGVLACVLSCGVVNSSFASGGISSDNNSNVTGKEVWQYLHGDYGLGSPFKNYVTLAGGSGKVRSGGYIAIGGESIGNLSVTLGLGSSAGSNGGASYGVYNYGSIAIGADAKAPLSSDVVVGASSGVIPVMDVPDSNYLALTRASGGNVVVGGSSSVKGTSNYYPEYNVLVGYGSQVTGKNSTVLGSKSNVTGDDSVAIGSRSYVKGNNSVAIGVDSYASESNTVAVGYSPSQGRRIVNVLNGTSASDAATVSQVSTTVAGTGITVSSTTNSNGSTKYTIAGKNMTAATASAAGTAGLVPAPAAGKQTAFLRGDGTWVVPTNTTYSAGTGLALSGTTFSVNANGSIASGNANPLKGGTVYSEVRPTANGTFVKTANTTAANLTALDTASKNAIKALSVNGKTITYTKGDGTTGTITTQDTTYGNMSASELSTGTATNARSISAKVVSDYVKGKTDDKVMNLSVSGSTLTYTKGNGSSGTVTLPVGKYNGSNNIVVDNDNNISTKNVLVYDADANDVATLAGNSGTKLTNLKGATLSRTSTDAVTGAQLYATNQNIVGFATDINRNKTNIQNLNTSVTAALESVSASSQLVDVINNTKADKSLNNLDAAGMQVISNAAANAVQEYMATQESTRKSVDENTQNPQPMLMRSVPLMRSVNPVSTDTNYVVYDDDTSNKITLEGDNGTVISNVSNGEISGTSTDAINGSQLYGASKIITDVLDLKADKDSVYTKSETDMFLGKKADLSYVNEELTAVRTQKADKSYVDEELSKKADTMYVDDQLSLKADTSYVDNQLSLKADKDAVYTKTEANELFADKKETTESLNRKADTDASNIDVDAWSERLGTGEIAEGNEGLVKGGKVYDALSRALQATNSDMLDVDVNTGAIRIAGKEKYDKFDVMDISKSDGSPRVMRGVITDASDATSAANVGYVNAVAENVAQQVNTGMQKMDTKVNRVGANAAALAALTPASFEGDEKWSLAASVGNYRGEIAGAVGAFYKPTENVMVNVRGSFGNNESMVAGGVAVALTKGDIPGVTKRQLAKAVNTQAQTIKVYETKMAEQNDRINQQDNRIAELEAVVAKLVAKKQ